MFCPTNLFSIEANEGAEVFICSIRTILDSITECGGVDTGGVPTHPLRHGVAQGTGALCEVC